MRPKIHPINGKMQGMDKNYKIILCVDPVRTYFLGIRQECNSECCEFKTTTKEAKKELKKTDPDKDKNNDTK